MDFLRRQPCADAIAEKIDGYVAHRDEDDPVEQHRLMQAFYDERDAKAQATV